MQSDRRCCCCGRPSACTVAVNRERERWSVDNSDGPFTMAAYDAFGLSREEGACANGRWAVAREFVFAVPEVPFGGTDVCTV